MIVGRIPDAAGLVAPESSASNSSPEIDVEVSKNLDDPFDPEWISCGMAVPHDDTHMGENDLLYVTLVVNGDHVVSDTQHPANGFHVQRGDVFVVDPEIVHWCFPSTIFWNSSGYTREIDGKTFVQLENFVGLQWRVTKANAIAEIKEILHRYGGEWKPHRQSEYSTYRPPIAISEPEALV